MFSANENILLRQHKRRVIDYVESTIPEDALDLGTAVMAMQVSCRQPGCVPLETAITVVFPKPPRKMKKKRNTAQQQQQDNKSTNDNNDTSNRSSNNDIHMMFNSRSSCMGQSSSVHTVWAKLVSA